MPIDVFWDDDAKTILRSNFIGNWTWEEYHTSDEQIAAMTATIDYRFDVISDMSESAGIPKGNILEHAGRGQNVTIPHLGIIVTIRPYNIMEAMRPIASAITGRDNRYSAQSIEDAYAIIQSARNEKPS